MYCDEVWPVLSFIKFTKDMPCKSPPQIVRMMMLIVTRLVQHLVCDANIKQQQFLCFFCSKVLKDFFFNIFWRSCSDFQIWAWKPQEYAAAASSFGYLSFNLISAAAIPSKGEGQANGIAKKLWSRVITHLETEAILQKCTSIPMPAFNFGPWWPAIYISFATEVCSTSCFLLQVSFFRSHWYLSFCWSFSKFFSAFQLRFTLDKGPFYAKGECVNVDALLISTERFAYHVFRNPFDDVDKRLRVSGSPNAINGGVNLWPPLTEWTVQFSLVFFTKLLAQDRSYEQVQFLHSMGQHSLTLWIQISRSRQNMEFRRPKLKINPNHLQLGKAQSDALLSSSALLKSHTEGCKVCKARSWFWPLDKCDSEKEAFGGTAISKNQTQDICGLIWYGKHGLALFTDGFAGISACFLSNPFIPTRSTAMKSTIKNQKLLSLSGVLNDVGMLFMFQIFQFAWGVQKSPLEWRLSMESIESVLRVNVFWSPAAQWESAKA